MAIILEEASETLEKITILPEGFLKDYAIMASTDPS